MATSITGVLAFIVSDGMVNVLNMLVLFNVVAADVVDVLKDKLVGDDVSTDAVVVSFVIVDMFKFEFTFDDVIDVALVEVTEAVVVAFVKVLVSFIIWVVEE